ncbi:patatin-like phospholipase family protein, partial [candidate division WOR-3 bacterium]|nr:patatin-like phospholipase family protein [candidate division WOR-3 bacterium]
MKRNKLGLAFGGGSGRGVAHLGVIKCLEEEGIKANIVTGTSMGAIIAALYSYDYNFDQIVKKFRDILDSDEFKQLGFESFPEHEKGHLFSRMNTYIKERMIYAKMLLTPYITERETLRKVITKIVPDVNIEDLPIPFASVALDLISGEDVIIKEGKLIDAVLKTASIVGFFPPWDENGKMLVDGGPTANVPVDAAYSLGADRVIGINLSSKLSRTFNPKSALSLNFRIDEIAKFRLNKMRANKADVLIEPTVKSIHWSDFSKIDFGIRMGYSATRE